MLWSRWYSFKSYIRSALWVVPVVALLLQIIAGRLTEMLDARLMEAGRLNQTGLLALGVSGARALLETIITLNISFLVFTFGSLLVAIQVASGQYTPRIIATMLLRDNGIRYSVGCFVFTLLFSLRTLNQMDTTVHQLQTLISGVLGAFSIMVFLYLIDYAARMLRPINIVRRIGQDGLAVIRSAYPLETTGPNPLPPRPRAAIPCRTVNHRGSPGIVLAVNLDELATQVRNMNGFIEFVPYVGDFVDAHEPLFRLYGEACSLDDRLVRALVAFGPERTLEQDPTFAFRILVDIALKALSPAINDPTTATLSIDQLHRMLFVVGSRHLQGEEITDRHGELRLVFRTPDWEDFVQLAFTEIRHCGAGSVQIARRLRAMGEHLVQDLPSYRHAALESELNLLDRTIEKHYPLPEDLALARVPDAQGLGSSRT